MAWHPRGGRGPDNPQQLVLPASVYQRAHARLSLSIRRRDNYVNKEVFDKE